MELRKKKEVVLKNKINVRDVLFFIAG